jgi:hypothetical protein
MFSVGGELAGTRFSTWSVLAATGYFVLGKSETGPSTARDLKRPLCGSLRHWNSVVLVSFSVLPDTPSSTPVRR